MKKILGILMLVSVLMLSACQSDTKHDNGDISIVTTSFHEFDWVNQIIGEDNEKFDITLLMDNGVDLHSYQPSVEDIAKITSADLFIHNGGLSDTWGKDAAAQAEDLLTINVMEVLLENDALVEGHACNHDHAEGESCGHDHAEGESCNHDHAEGESCGHDHAEGESCGHDHSEHDEHVWLSLKNAIVICETLTEQICLLDEANRDVYEQNSANYINLLKELNETFKATVSEAERDTVIIADRFPFKYLMNDYGINHHAAFEGCSAESEASFETVAFLADKIDELSVEYVIVIENGSDEVDKTVIDSSDNKDCEIITMSSIEGVGLDAATDGVSYYSLMKNNFETLEKALSK